MAARRRTASSAEEAWTVDETELGWDLDNPVRPTIAADRPFELVSEFEPRGSQPQAIAELVAGLEANEPAQVLLGITGSGKTFTIANVIAKVQRPTLILAHNKTLSSTSSRTTTITSPRPTSRRLTRISRRTRTSTSRSTACATRRPTRCSRVAT